MDDVLWAVDTAVAEHFGHPPARATVSFVGVDPIEVLRFEPIPGERVYLSLGMSRFPMTGAAESTVAPDGPRGELMLHLHDPVDQYSEVWRRVALLAATPVVEGVVYTDGLTVEIGEPLAAGSRCVGVVVDAAPLEPVTTPQGAVTIWQIVPATANELAWARVHGAAELRGRWRDSGTDLLDLARAPVTLA